MPKQERDKHSQTVNHKRRTVLDSAEFLQLFSDVDYKAVRSLWHNICVAELRSTLALCYNRIPMVPPINTDKSIYPID